VHYVAQLEAVCAGIYPVLARHELGQNGYQFSGILRDLYSNRVDLLGNRIDLLHGVFAVCAVTRSKNATIKGAGRK